MLICVIQESSGGGEDPGWESARCLQRGSDTGGKLALPMLVGDHEDSVGGGGADDNYCVAGLWCRGVQTTTFQGRAAPYLGD